MKSLSILLIITALVLLVCFIAPASAGRNLRHSHSRTTQEHLSPWGIAGWTPARMAHLQRLRPLQRPAGAFTPSSGSVIAIGGAAALLALVFASMRRLRARRAALAVYLPVSCSNSSSNRSKVNNDSGKDVESGLAAGSSNTLFTDNSFLTQWYSKYDSLLAACCVLGEHRLHLFSTTYWKLRTLERLWRQCGEHNLGDAQRAAAASKVREQAATV